MQFNESEIQIFKDLIERGHQYLEILQAKGKTEAIKDEDFKFRFEAWSIDALRFMESHFDKKTTVFGQFAHHYVFAAKMIPSYLQKAITVMETYYKMPNDTINQPPPTTAGGNNININVNQQQSQNQSQQMNLNVLLDAIKEQLRGREYNELKDIVNDPTLQDEEKKKSFIDRLRSFGDGTMASILATYITNSGIWNYLVGML